MMRRSDNFDFNIIDLDNDESRTGMVRNPSKSSPERHQTARFSRNTTIDEWSDNAQFDDEWDDDAQFDDEWDDDEQTSDEWDDAQFDDEWDGGEQNGDGWDDDAQFDDEWDGGEQNGDEWDDAQLNDEWDGGKQNGDRKKHPFRTFLLLWSSFLLIAIFVGLILFYRFLGNYEAAYQASRPTLDMDRYLSLFRSKDYDAVYSLLTEKPECSPFETLDDFKTYLAQLSDGHSLSYVPADGYTEDSPKYRIMADDLALAGLDLTRSDKESLPYGFPIWEIADFKLYAQPAESFVVQSPSNYTVSVNGIPLGEAQLSEAGFAPEEEKYVKEYASLPTCDRYSGDGLYLPPDITAVDDYGQDVPVTYDETQKMYIVPFSSHTPDQEALEAYAIKAVEDYCEYVSQDLSDTGLDKYFPSGSNVLYLIKHNSSRQFFAHHRSSDFQNVEVKKFISYSSDVFYCEVYVEQVLIMSYGSPEPEVLPYTGRFYFVRINGEWKIASIVY